MSFRLVIVALRQSRCVYNWLVLVYYLLIVRVHFGLF